jgi:hypothetical protein
LLTVLYLAGTVQVASLHGLIHGDHDAAAVHSMQNEADPCHISLFHDKAEQSCDHDSHLTRPSDCPLCQYCSPLPHLVADLVNVAPSPATDDSSFVLFTGEPIRNTFCRETRGPPEA